jgi:transposase InsO family protein
MRAQGTDKPHSLAWRCQLRRFAAQVISKEINKSNIRMPQRPYSLPSNTAVLQGPVEPGQYVSLAFGQAARDAGISRSMGSKGDCFDCDNASAAE